MTASQEQDQGRLETGGPDVWLDMSRFPDTDPDTVLSSDEHSLLTASLAVDDSELPDAVWEHMLAAVVGDADPASDDPAVDASEEPGDDGSDGSDWSDDAATEQDPTDHQTDDPTDDPAGHDDGGWV